MDTRDFSVDTIQEIYDIIEELKGQGTIGDSIHDFWCIGEPDAIMLCTYASRDEMTEYYEKYADGMDLTKKKFDKIVENVREVDSKYQEEFLKSKEELKNFGETLKNMTEEISLRTLSLDTSHYNMAIGVIEGEDNEKKEKLKELIGITPGTIEESEVIQKIQEILKYSTGNGGLDDEIDVESEEATLLQKKKLIAQVESLKEQFRNGGLTQDELLDKICEIYHVEDYGSQIDYSLAFKKYMPEKKARIVSDILSTAMYIMEEDGLDAEKIEEIAQSVKAKSYIEDEQWTMLENAFRGVVVGTNAAIAGKYYTGQTGNVERGKYSNATFATEDKLVSHFEKHGDEFKGLYNSADEYLQGAREVMNNGYKVEYSYKGETRIGYVQFMGNNSKGKAKFAFVGTNNEGYITTFHTESGKTFWKLLNDGENIPVINPK